MNKKSSKILKIYNELQFIYSHQGWWPVLDYETRKTGIKGYHPQNYKIPRNNKEQFEICLGAILTQNTSWKNTEKAIMNLDKAKAISPEAIISMEKEKLAQLIKPAGYFNQRAKKIKEFAKFYISLKGRTPLREELLNVWGIGRETADSILLYAYKVSIFVVDAYTRRLFSNLEICNEKDDYDKIQELIEKNLPKDFKIYQEYHALIVEHGKRHYSRNPRGVDCFLKNRKRGINNRSKSKQH